MSLERKIREKMKEHFGPDARRIRHAQNVLQYAKELLEIEGGDSDIVIASALLHDVGIKECERKYGTASGQLQEKEGPPIARKILEQLKMPKKDIDQVSRIIASHHSPGEIGTLNFKVLYDADWLVNLKDEYDTTDDKRLRHLIRRVFLTPGGRAKALEVYLK